MAKRRYPETGSQYNYSTQANGPVVTRFTRIRFDPSNQKVEIGDKTYSTSTGKYSDPYYDVTSMPYGTAYGCEAYGYANVNLAGTHFKIASTWGIYGNIYAEGNVTPTAEIGRVIIESAGLL